MTHEANTSHPGGAPAHWACDVILLDGSTVHVLPLDPEDAARLVAFHAGLSDGTVYLRSFAPKPTPSPDEVARFTHVDHDASVALVAEAGDRLLAVARYDRAPGPTRPKWRSS